jgi:hypothetical protein
MAGTRKQDQHIEPSNDEQGDGKSNQEKQQFQRNPRRRNTAAKEGVSIARRSARSESIDAAKSQNKGAVTYELQSPAKEVSIKSQVTYLVLVSVLSFTSLRVY